MYRCSKHLYSVHQSLFKAICWWPTVTEHIKIIFSCGKISITYLVLSFLFSSDTVSSKAESKQGVRSSAVRLVERTITFTYCSVYSKPQGQTEKSIQLSRIKCIKRLTETLLEIERAVNYSSLSNIFGEAIYAHIDTVEIQFTSLYT